MKIHNNGSFSIYFGDAHDNLMPAYYFNLVATAQSLLDLSSFASLKGALRLNAAMFLHQTHSNKGVIVDHAFLEQALPFKVSGDYLITREKKVGIGVMTADCLPIIMYDTKNNATAVIHAGWRGSVIGVAVKALEHMQEAYGTRPEDIRVFFGPSARVCCYEVSSDFERHIEGFSYAHKTQVIIERDNKLFFDLSLFNRLQLEAIGINPQAISREYNLCTMCNNQFYSYRRDGENAGRQMTVICLNG